MRYCHVMQGLFLSGVAATAPTVTATDALWLSFPDMAVNFTDDIAFGIGNAGFRTLFVQDRRTRPHCLFRIKYRM